MPEDRCIPFAACSHCGKLIETKGDDGECCIFCVHGDVPCLMHQVTLAKKQKREISDSRPVVAQIETLLRDGGFWYERFEHPPVRTSEEAAKERPEYSITQGTKSLIVRAKRTGREKEFIMVIVPGDKKFDRKKLKAQTGYDDARFATPEEVAELTNGILPGGVPPFGNLFQLPMFVDQRVFVNEKIIFNAGDRRISIAMKSRDYRELVRPEIFDIAQ